MSQLQQAAERTQHSTAAVAAKLAAAHAQVVLSLLEAWLLLHRLTVPHVSCPVVLRRMPSNPSCARLGRGTNSLATPRTASMLMSCHLPVQVAEKQADLERAEARLAAERATAHAEQANAATLRQRLDGAVRAIALLEARVASAQQGAAKDAEALQVGYSQCCDHLNLAFLSSGQLVRRLKLLAPHPLVTPGTTAAIPDMQADMAEVQLQRDDLFHKASTLTQQVRSRVLAVHTGMALITCVRPATRFPWSAQPVPLPMVRRWRGCRQHWRPRTGALRTCALQRPPATRSVRRCRSSKR